MQPRNLHLKQLQRDAAKAGAWQAKLALGRYLLKEAESLKPKEDAVTEKNNAKIRAASVKKAESVANQKEEELIEARKAKKAAIEKKEKALKRAIKTKGKLKKAKATLERITLEAIKAEQYFKAESAALETCDSHPSSFESTTELNQNSLNKMREEIKAEINEREKKARIKLNTAQKQLQSMEKIVQQTTEEQIQGEKDTIAAEETLKQASKVKNNKSDQVIAARRAVELEKTEADKKIESAKKYFTEVSNSNSPYAQIANVELKILNTTESGSIETQNNKNLLSIPNRYHEAKTTEALENQYKSLRLAMQNKIDSNSLDVNFIDETIAKFKHLLQDIELTDTLKAKIYFQLIHLHLQKAHQSGRLNDLNRALTYCDLLCSDQYLKDMNKTKMAEQIRSDIRGKIVNGALRKNLKDPIRDTKFSSWIKFSVRLGIMASRSIFKYIGLLIGNVMDLCLLFTPKYFKKDDFSGRFKLYDNNALREWKTNWVRVGLKHRGLARAGRWIGKHVLGNLFVPITIVLGFVAGILTYPFVKITQLFSENNVVKSKAKDILDLSKSPITERVFNTNNTSNSTMKAKKIFTLDEEKLKDKISLPSSKTHSEAIEQNRYKLGKGELGCSYAYGRVFATAPKPNAAPMAPKPVYEDRNTAKF